MIADQPAERFVIEVAQVPRQERRLRRRRQGLWIFDALPRLWAYGFDHDGRLSAGHDTSVAPAGDAPAWSSIKNSDSTALTRASIALLVGFMFMSLSAVHFSSLATANTERSTAGASSDQTCVRP